MANNAGFMIERNIVATDVLAYNRYCVAEIDVDGGNLVALTAPTTQDSNVFSAEAPTSDGQGNLWVAYNPTFRYTEIGDGEYSGISNDIRDYTNRAGKTFTAFKPVADVDTFFISAECVDEASRASVAAGSVLQAKSGQTQWTLVSDKTDGATAVSVMCKAVLPFPAKKGSLGMTSQAGFEVAAI